jgi:membrane protease YdiL (CAAX protease family)
MNGKFIMIARAVLAVLVFSVFIKLDSIFQVMNSLAERGWSLTAILVAALGVRMLLAGFAVLFVLPPIFQMAGWRTWLPGYLQGDWKTMLLGVLSFGMFAALAVAISLPMGIFLGDTSIVFSSPDIRPDPDIIGWGYFLLALVPGLWEELAYRGLFLSKFRQAFSKNLSIFLSALFFGLFHLSNLVNQAPDQALSGVVMAFFFGIGWGTLTTRSGSVLPAVISHYLVDSLGWIFFGVDSADPALVTGFYLLLTLLFPVGNIMLARWFYKHPGSQDELASQPV